jgi:hypothetical protein
MKDVLFAIIGATVISAVLLLNDKNKKENFWGGLPSRAVKVDQEIREPTKYGEALFSVPPTYQASLSPRFSNLDYGANIRYNFPDQSHLGSPSNPLTYGSSQVNRHAGIARCGGGGVENYEPIGQSVAQMAEMGTIPTTQRLSVMNAGGEVEQPIVYDRFIFANQRSRLYGLGDPIRGDLPIAPVKSDWFRPSVHPTIDLRDGAMSVMGGMNNTTANELRALQTITTGGVDVNNPSYEQIMNPATSQRMSALGVGQNDIQVTAFP